MLVTSAEMVTLSGDFGQAFDTFSYNRTITVHKEPLKTLSANFSNNNGLFGFGESQQGDMYDYTPVSQDFPAVIRYKTNINDPLKTELDAFYSKAGCSIQVKKDCYDYIMTNKTEKIQFDDRAWAIVGAPRTKKFLLNEHYIFYLQNLQ